MGTEFSSLKARAAAVAAALAVVSGASAGETRGFVVSMFWPTAAAQSQQADCPKGLNPKTNEMVLQTLHQLGKTPQEIAALMDDFPVNVDGLMSMRGRINGKPADPYRNPMSVPDPHLNTVEGNLAYGFNLDGNEATGGFTDPETGEKGVDNQLFRVNGCTGSTRGEPGSVPLWPYNYWTTQLQDMHAWMVEISGIDDLQNDDDVVVRISGATTPVILDARARVQADMTFQEDSNPLTKNLVHGRIKNGVLTTDVMPHLNLNGDRAFYSEMRFRAARLRLKLNPDGTAKGILGGYHNWVALWMPDSRSFGQELSTSTNTPGKYYAFRKLADASPDPKTGLNTEISTAFELTLVPAFIRHVPPPALQASTQVGEPAPETEAR
jgi:hypothetical protein